MHLSGLLTIGVIFSILGCNQHVTVNNHLRDSGKWVTPAGAALRPEGSVPFPLQPGEFGGESQGTNIFNKNGLKTEVCDQKLG